ncbi:MAG: beta-galactosidase/beta-glucuronidase [Frankiales bacterium]|nr:beta-galactosidase/beta-glucuronidase [Frankiales bacterium]
MPRVPLTTARLVDADPGEDLSTADASSWLEVPVPYDVHRALVDAGRLADPDHGDGDAAAGWVGERTWWWQLQLPALGEVGPEERVLLELQGLDTLATVFLDGVEVATSRDMHLPLVLDVTATAGRWAGSVLAVRFDPLGPEPDLRTLRKAAYGLGWDFAPHRPSVGVWRPVVLVRSRTAALDDVRFRTLALADGRADVEVGVDVVRLAEAPLLLDVVLHGPDARVVAAQTLPVDGPVTVPLVLQDPALWWTHDEGEPALHRLVVTLRTGDDVLQVEERSVGVRTVELDRSGGAFSFVLNGRLLWVQGANWVPASTSPGAVEPGRTERLVQAARDAHLSMLRVWGGGVVEDDRFYDACDRLGILVWQDFLFAGAQYTDEDPGFVALVEAEARAQVRRLRSRACLALWCGNNEVALLAEVFGWQPEDPAGRLFGEVLARVVDEEDGRTAYVPTSPVRDNGERGGDKHAWQVWHGLDLRDDRSTVAWVLDGPRLGPGSPEAEDFARLASTDRYLDDDARFVSEHGLCATPTWETLVRWTDPEQLHLGAEQVARRARPGRLGPVDKHDVLLHSHAGPTPTLRHWVEESQAMQAEGLAVGIEHYRRSWPHCSGQLVWQLDDCWPATSWALVDHDLRPKAGWYAVRRACAPVLTSFRRRDDGRWELWVSTRAPVRDVLQARCRGFDGALLWSVDVEVDVGRGSRCVAVLPATGDPARCHLAVDGAHGASLRLLARPRDLVREVVPPVWSTRRVDDAVEVTVSAPAYARAVHVDHPGSPLWFDDAWFDVEAGTTRVLRAPAAPGLDLDALALRSR